MNNSPKFIVVIGTSAGGIRALEELFTQLTPDMDAAFLVVLHLSRKGVGEVFFHRLAQRSPIRCKIAEDDEPIERGTIYLAPPDEHLLVTEGRILIRHGAMENHWRPSINNLFRTAAAVYTSHVIGIILTGLLDDGSAGMTAIKRAGGITIVQDPNEADHPDMPLSVLSNIEVDHVESLANMGNLLSEIIKSTEPEVREAPFDVQVEAKIDQDFITRTDDLAPFERYDINCPDCGGGLFITQKEHPAHFRCFVGHSYTERELLIRVSEVIEEEMWYLLRIMEERRTLLSKFHKRDKEKGYSSSAAKNQEQVKTMENNIEVLKKMLPSSTKVN
jgi:two-component system, chemotaxis family, protein-glutamate methylesterase/glutaminase